MCDFGIPFVCIQCGTDQNPCHVKVVGPTLGFGVGVLSAQRFYELQVSQIQPALPPLQGRFQLTNAIASMLASLALRRLLRYGSGMLGAPVDINGQVSNAIPF
ncbi:uncharacterized protein EAE98_003895 [Botrytis deweyae]|uniref:Uncharacterized protein n=1 Tax=Botrytis deweyae TaxID=2478750 RepID=A0ABQ7IS07_9HELO|nr:uncharacterized protein EAE98_003895 [Botrytis deweyae]KAF7932596.1 hypothetical protein EAE98_003895 [Botrytis deweyae]